MKFLRPICLANLILVIACTAFAQASQTTDKEKLRADAFALVKQNQYIDAHALLEKLAPLYPNDAEVWAHYGIAILTRSVTLTSPDERKSERVKGYNALIKAKNLGTENVIALNLLDQLSPDGGDEDNFSGKADVEKNLREGEGFFGKGEYDKAFASYEKAYKADPKSYEAVLFMGDTLYAAQKYKESEAWFAKAVEIDRNREMAYRYWGDALMEQKKTREAGDKFIDALVADPYSRMTWDRLGKWVDESRLATAALEVVPPGNDTAGSISINENLLKAEDGTLNWRFYVGAGKSSSEAVGGHRSLAEEVAAYKRVADGYRADLKSGKVKYPDKSLTNLARIDDLGYLEPYILVVRPVNDVADGYAAYRDKNREKVRNFVLDVILGIKK